MDQGSIPITYDRPLPDLQVTDVIEKIKAARKPSSQVPGDIEPVLYSKFPELLAVPLTDVFNSITRTLTWPSQWTVEYVTVIPKCLAPDSPNDCRNISCTNFCSKLYESFVLGWTREQVKVKPNQFGGEKRCGSTHFLVEALHEITSAMEDNRNACVLTSIDFSKAFNRLAHGPCLDMFAKKGASSQIISLLASFLTGRRMTVRIGSETSSLRHVNAGAPQGSVLGSFLFTVGIDDIEEGCVYPDAPFVDLPGEHRLQEEDFPASSTPQRVRTSVQDAPFSPIQAASRDLGFALLPRVMNVPPWIRKKKEATYVKRPPVDLKYIDDGLDIVTVNMKTVALCSEGDPPRPIKIIHPVESQAMLDHVVMRAADKGMLVNDAKTNLMCITAASSYSARAELMGRNGEKICDKKSMKTLGYILDSDCGQSSNVAAMRSKLRARTWALPTLKKCGYTQEELVKIYCTMMRPTVEYCSPAWGSMLTQEQVNCLEQQQVQALKHIYGVGISASKLRHRANIKTLASRRKEAALRFAKKAESNPRFQHWFTRRPPGTRGRRSNTNYRIYEEEQFRTDRFMNSPLNYLRRILNE